MSKISPPQGSRSAHGPSRAVSSIKQWTTDFSATESARPGSRRDSACPSGAAGCDHAHGPIGARHWRRPSAEIVPVVPQQAISAQTHSAGGPSQRARSSISGELSTPTMRAAGQRLARTAVLLPGPQPRSAIRSARRANPGAKSTDGWTRSESTQVECRIQTGMKVSSGSGARGEVSSPFDGGYVFCRIGVVRKRNDLPPLVEVPEMHLLRRAIGLRPV